MKGYGLLILLLQIIVNWDGFAQLNGSNSPNTSLWIDNKNSKNLIDITPYTMYMQDSMGKMPFKQVQKLPLSAFKLNGEGGLNLGNTTKPYWFRVDFIDSSNTNDLYLLIKNSYIKDLQVFVITQNDKVLNWETGLNYPSGQYFFESNMVNFNIGAKPKYLYLRVEKWSMHLLMHISSVKPLVDYQHKQDLFLGCLIGVIIALALYNIFLFISLKDNLFLYYSFYSIASVGIIFMSQGLHHEFLWYNRLWMSQSLNPFLLLFNCLCFLFATKYLDTRKLAPRFYWTLLTLCLIGLFLLPLEIFLNYNWVRVYYQFSQIIFMILVFTCGIYTWKIGFQPASFFVIAWSFLVLGSIISTLSIIGILSVQNYLIYHSWQIGIACETLLISFAVANRFNLFRQEAKDAYALALQRAQENEKLLSEHTRILEEKLQLEQKVFNQSSNESINALIEKMKTERGTNKKLPVATIDGILLLPMLDIVRLEAMGSYCTIFLTQQKKIVASKPLAEFEVLLDNNNFLRVHKSHMINLNFVERYLRGEGGFVIMTDGAEVSVSKMMKSELLERLNIT